MNGEESPVQIHLALPKGHMQENVFKLFEDAGIKVVMGHTRGYRPQVPLKNYDVKLLKPQNILGMIATGVRDCGFAGGDWVNELNLGDSVFEVMDTEMDPVRIVAAAPDPKIMERGGLGGRKLIVASEYENLTKKWLDTKGVPYTFLRAYGATESLPPEDADVIVDNAATGSTLKANSLEVFDTLMSSTTRLFASRGAWADPAKRARIEKLAMLLRSVLDARKRALLTFNVAADKVDGMVAFLGKFAMRQPTVSALYGASGATVGYALQIAAQAAEIPNLIPHIKDEGGTDIIVTGIKMLIA